MNEKLGEDYSLNKNKVLPLQLRNFVFDKVLLQSISSRQHFQIGDSFDVLCKQ